MDEYHLAEQIGEGSFGKVFKGRRRYTSQIVALKLINKHGKSEKDMRNLRQVCAAIISRLVLLRSALPMRACESKSVSSTGNRHSATAGPSKHHFAARRLRDSARVLPCH